LTTLKTSSVRVGAAATFAKLVLSDSALAVMARFLTYAGAFAPALLAGLVLTASEQGLFFTFLSFSLLAVIVELGLNTVIVQFTSHEKARHDEAASEMQRALALSRMISVGRFAFKWFWCGAFMFALALMPFGFVFFGNEADAAAAIPGPWIALTLFVAVDIALFPCWAILEGINRVRTVYGYRCARAIAMCAGTCLGLVAGAKLWSLGLGFAATIPISGLVLYRHRRFFSNYTVIPDGHHVSWKSEMLPLQWRLALSWVSGYVANWAITPITLKTLGPEAAAQIGMTWAVVGGVSAVASMVVAVRASRFGMLVATRRFRELDQLALRLGALSIGLAMLGMGLAAIALSILVASDHPLSERFLPFGPTIMIMTAVVLVHITLPMSVYLRAHKREPYLGISIAHAICAVAAATYLAHYFGVGGITAGYLLSAALLVLPIGTAIFVRCRKAWHQEAARI
jgi:hypothetical protein